MPAKNKTLTIYPDPRVTTIIGTSAGELHQALDCWSVLLTRATADNKDVFKRNEWAAIADTLARTKLSPDIIDPSDQIVRIMHDTDTVEGIAAKHKVDLGQLEKKLRALDYVHCWAAVTAIEWFKDNADVLSEDDPWWTLDFKRRTVEKHKKKK